MASSSAFREREQKSLQGEREARMALLWQEDGKPLRSLCSGGFWELLWCVGNASRLLAGCGRLRVGDVVHDIPQSYPFCSGWSRYLCKDSQPGGPKGVCVKAHALALKHRYDGTCVCVCGWAFACGVV